VAKGIARALRLRGATRPLRDDRVWCCGRIDWHGREREVVFASGLGKREESLVLPGLDKLLHPIVLVPEEVPEPERWCGEPPTVVALARFVDLDENGLVVDRSALKAMILQAETGDKVADFVFLLSGDFWQVTYRGTTKHLKDTVGMGYLARLLAQPHRDIPAVALLAARAGIDPLVTQGSSEKLIDEKARTEYRERYSDLEEEIEDAEACHDTGRLERAQTERQQLVDELTRTAGLGGKLRERSDADRVRKAVSMAVNRDIENIAEHHGELGRHLQVSISSGLQFRYTPETPIDWLT
jgi:soluble cytochrome b562